MAILNLTTGIVFLKAGALAASGDGAVATGVGSGSVFASNGVGVQGVWTPSPTLTSVTTTGNTSLGGDAVIFGNTNEIWTQSTVNATADLVINRRGYLGSTTQFRNFKVGDGKTANFPFSVDGASHVVSFDTAVAVGADTANTGGARFGNSVYAYWRNSTNTVDLFGIGYDSSNQLFLGNAAHSVLPNGDANIALGNPSFRWLSASVSSYIEVGTNPATAGIIRLPHGNAIGPQIMGRNSVNNADIDVLKWGYTNDVLELGPAAAGSVVAINASRVAFNGLTANFPALSRDTIFLRFLLADASGVSGAATASLPAAAAGRDGIIGFDTTLNAIVYYVGGARYKLVGTAF